MSRYDIDDDFEGLVRDELRRTIVPPPAPEYVREGVEKMARENTESAAQQRRARGWFTRPLVLVRAAAIAAAVVLVGGTVALIGSRPGGPAAAHTLPLAPTDVDATPGPTISTGFAFAGASDSSLLDLTADGAAVVYENGHGLRISTDSGVTWSQARTVPVPAPRADEAAWNIEFIDALHGWQLESVETETDVHLTEFRTADSARTWQATPVASFAKSSGWYAFAWTHFVSPASGVVHAGLYKPRPDQEAATEGCRSFRTSDGGATWSAPVTEPCLAGIDAPPGPVWSTDLLGFMFGGVDRVAVTQDGGLNWKVGTLPTMAGEMGAQGLLLSNDGSGRLSYVAQITPSGGADWPPREAIFESGDGGVTWQEDYSGRFPGHVGFGGIVALTPNRWLSSISLNVEPGDELIESLDAGRTWLALPGPRFDQVTAMRWWDGRRGVVEARDSSCTPESQQAAARSGEPAPASPATPAASTCAASSVYVTNDGGATWHHVPF
jgi:hypothetical protein